MKPPFMLTALFIVTALAACAPSTRAPQTSAPAETGTPGSETEESTVVISSPAALETDRIAREAFHLMELEYLRTGTYTTNVLLNLERPRTVSWMLEDISEEGYLLRFTSTELPEIAWFVSPDGVEVRQVEQTQIY